MRHVPCNGCRLCCQQLIVELADDEAGEYERVRGFDTETETYHWLLKRRENGDCIYLTESGCSIYDRRPSQCREFDCRLLSPNHDRVDVVKRGHELMRT